MQRNPAHLIRSIGHEHFRPVVITVARAARHAIDFVARIIFDERVVTLEIVRIKFRTHVATAAPAFVAHRPERNLPRLVPPVLPPQVGHRRIRRARHVFHPLHHLLHRTAAHVAANARVTIDLLAKIHELMRAEMIVLHHAAPGRVDDGRTLLARTHAVHPMIFVGKAAARPAHHRDFYFLERRHHVVADAARVRNRAVRADPDAFINAMAQMFGKLSVNILADDGRARSGVNDQRIGRRRLCHGGHGNDQSRSDGGNFSFHQNLAVCRISINCFITSNRFPLPAFVPNASWSLR